MMRLWNGMHLHASRLTPKIREDCKVYGPSIVGPYREWHDGPIYGFSFIWFHVYAMYCTCDRRKS